VLCSRLLIIFQLTKFERPTRGPTRIGLELDHSPPRGTPKLRLWEFRPNTITKPLTTNYLTRIQVAPYKYLLNYNVK
jgi:hypothetical protein